MGIFKKKKKDEYWFVPSTGNSVYGLQTEYKEAKKASKSKAEVKKPSNAKSIKPNDAPQVTVAAKGSDTPAKKSAAETKPAAKATVNKTAKSSSKASTVNSTAKKAPKTSAKTAETTKKSAAKKPAESKSNKAQERFVSTSKGSAVISKTSPKEIAAQGEKKAAKSKQKKNSDIVTVMATEDIPRAVYYDEDASNALAGDASGEKIEVSGFQGAFEIRKSRDNRYVFNLTAKNHVIIATSQIYSSSQSAMTGINSVVANAERANVEDQTLKKAVSVPFPKWEIYIDRAGEYRFRLCASNGSCVCHSYGGYKTKSGCKNGIDSIIRTSSGARVDKAYLK